MEITGDKNTLPFVVGRTYNYAPGCFVRVEHIEPGRYYYKVYIRLCDGKLHSNKIIKVLNTNAFEMAGRFFMVGSSIKSDLVNRNEIL